jgi:hypothetical protein
VRQPWQFSAQYQPSRFVRLFDTPPEASKVCARFGPELAAGKSGLALIQKRDSAPRPICHPNVERVRFYMSARARPCRLANADGRDFILALQNGVATAALLHHGQTCCRAAYRGAPTL